MVFVNFNLYTAYLWSFQERNYALDWQSSIANRFFLQGDEIVEKFEGRRKEETKALAQKVVLATSLVPVRY